MKPYKLTDGKRWGNQRYEVILRSSGRRIGQILRTEGGAWFGYYSTGHIMLPADGVYPKRSDMAQQIFEEAWKTPEEIDALVQPEPDTLLALTVEANPSVEVKIIAKRPDATMVIGGVVLDGRCFSGAARGERRIEVGEVTVEKCMMFMQLTTRQDLVDKIRDGQDDVESLVDELIGAGLDVESLRRAALTKKKSS